MVFQFLGPFGSSLAAGCTARTYNHFVAGPLAPRQAEWHTGFFGSLGSIFGPGSQDFMHRIHSGRIPAFVRNTFQLRVGGAIRFCNFVSRGDGSTKGGRPMGKRILLLKKSPAHCSASCWSFCPSASRIPAITCRGAGGLVKAEVEHRAYNFRPAHPRCQRCGEIAALRHTVAESAFPSLGGGLRRWNGVECDPPNLHHFGWSGGRV